MDEHGRMLLLSVLVIPYDAGLTLFNKTTVDIISVALHDLANLLNPRKVTGILLQRAPLLLITSFVEVA